MTPKITLERGRGVAYVGGAPLEIDAIAYGVLEALLDADGAVPDPGLLRQRHGARRLWSSVVGLNEALARCSPAVGYVAHHPGLGYQLVRGAASTAGLLGRDGELARVGALLREHRFVTVVGPGGMGKTSLARAVAARCADRYPDGVRFIDLAILAEGRELVGALGAALGIAHLTRDGLRQLAACLRGQHVLVVFDCCEHHTGVAAELAEALLRAAPGVDVLCTSREPLLAQGERIVRLAPMDLPDAVRLFVARARLDCPGDFVLDDHDAALVDQICRAVEGVPLALELAASMVGPLGLATLAQQTSRWLIAPCCGPGLAAMLDWSYDVLTPTEQRVLRRLALFRGGFTLEAAGAVAADAALDPDSVLETVMELASKSLVSMNAGSYRPRLLDVTREYACDKLAASGELHAVQGRHARWLADLMDKAEHDWIALPRTAWIALYAPWIDDILGAIDWALGPGQDALLGAHLAGIGFVLGDQAGVARAFDAAVQRALAAVGRLADPPAAILLRLVIVHADGRDLSNHPFARLMAEAEACLQRARLSGMPHLQSSPLSSLWGWPYVRGDYPASLEGAERIAHAATASADPYLELIGQRTMAQSLHFLGRHGEARHFAMLALANSGRRIPLSYSPSPVQVGTSMRIIVARLLWMEGAADQALAMSREALDSAQGDHPAAMCQVLAMGAIPVAFWRGELAHAAQLLVRLRERAERHGMGHWIKWAERFEDALQVIEGSAQLRDKPSLADTQEFSVKCRDHLVSFAPGLLMDDAIARGEGGMVGWNVPETLRAQAVRHLQRDGVDGSGTAAGLLQRSLALAREQGALGWSLRSATTLATLYLQRGARAQARAVLEPVLARCREGHGTADLRAASALRTLLD